MCASFISTKKPPRDDGGLQLVLLLEEDRFALRFHFGGSDERDTGGVALLCSNDHLGRPSEDLGVPAEDGVIVEVASSGDFLLEEHVLLHDGRDFGMGLEVRIVLEGDVDVAFKDIELALEFVTGLIAVSAAEARNLGEGFLVEADGLVEELGGVLEDHDALGLIVIDRGRGVLDLLLELLEIATGFELHDGEDDAREDEGEPKEEFEYLGSGGDFDGDLLVNDMHVPAFVVNKLSCCFV